MPTPKLPEYLTNNTDDNIQLFDYQTTLESSNTKVNLSKHTISFLRKGQKEVFGNNKGIKINHNHFLLMQSGHCLMTEKTPSPNQLYQSILLFFDTSSAVNFLEKYQLFTAPQRQTNSFYTFTYDDFTQDFVQNLERLSKMPLPLQQQILPLKFEEIMLYLTHLYGAQFLNAIIQNINDKSIRLQNIIEHNKFNKLTLEELAFLCNMSLSTFKREFAKIYQETPIKWLKSQRLNHIATLLKTQQKRPIDLYQEAGYENLSNFVQAFKKQFGITPKQYQEQ